MVSAGMGAISNGFATALPTISFSSNALLLAAGLDNFTDKIRSFRKPLEDSVRKVIIPSIGRNFDSGGRPSWPQLAQSTLASRSGDQILVRTGALQKGAMQLNNWSYTTTEAMMSQLPAKVWYGAIHQMGGSKVPARPFAMIQPEDEVAIDKIFDDWLTERLAVI